MRLYGVGFVAFAVACLAFVPLAVRSADALPDVETLRARMAAATGIAPAAYRDSIAYTGTAGDGKRVTLVRGDDRREIDDSNALHEERGVYKGEHWHENYNGHVVIDEADPGLATAEVYTTTVTRVSVPIDAFVIATLNAKHSGVREFVDPATFLVVRREVREPNGNSVTTYDDFRSFGKRRLATHWTVRDERTATTTLFTRLDYSDAVIADADIGIPQNRRMLVTYPAGTDSVVLPSTFAPDGHIIVRITVAGRGLDLLLDSGAGSITLDPGVAASLGLAITNKMQSAANAGRFATGDAIVPEIGIGSLTMHDTAVSIVPLDWQLGDSKAVGLLGFDFLCESGITIDYVHRKVTAQRFGTYGIPDAPGTIALDARLGTQQPQVSATINGAVAERMVLDTGGAGPFILNDYFVRRHPEALPRAGLTTRIVRMRGAGGVFETESVTLDSMQIGNIRFRDFYGLKVTSAASYSGDQDGVIGPQLLQLFDVHLDYPNGRVYLVPNDTARHTMH